MSPEYRDVLYRVTNIVPLFIDRRFHVKLLYTHDKYTGYMEQFLGIVQTSESLYDAIMNVKAHRNQLVVIERSPALSRAFNDMIDILGSTRKYYGVSNEILFKHDIVLQ